MSGNSELLRVGRTMWPFEWEPIQMGIENGIVWAITPGRIGGINGYVLIPAEGHPWSTGVPIITDDSGYEESAADCLEVHGGITYGGHPWIGFDTLHAFDMWPAEYDPGAVCRPSGSDLDRYWTIDGVIEEAKGLARQLAAVAGPF